MARHGIRYYVREIRDKLDRCAIFDLKGLRYDHITYSFPPDKLAALEKEMRTAFATFRETWIDSNLAEIEKRVMRKKDSETPQ